MGNSSVKKNRNKSQALTEKNTQGAVFLTVTLFLMIIVFAFMKGLNYEYLAIIAFDILAVYLCVTVAVNQKVVVKRDPLSISFIIIVSLYALTSIWAIDRGMAFLGFTKRTAIVMFILVLWQLNKEIKDKVRLAVPVAGVAMTAICGLCYLSEDLKRNFFISERLSGFFEYANTFAMFLLVGLITVLWTYKRNREGENKEDKKAFKTTITVLLSVILLFGILWTGSRTVAVLAVLVLLLYVLCLKNKKQKLAIFLSLAAILAVLFVLTFMEVIPYYSIGRIFTTSVSESTFIGRFLYWKDALALIKKYPFGMGSMGYSFLEGTVATGLYSVTYVHNDFVQLVLDIGVIPGLLFLICFLITLIKTAGKKDYGSLVLIFMFLHGLFDFDAEFMIMPMLFLLFMPEYEVKEKLLEKRASKTALTVIIVGLVIGLVPVAIASYKNKEMDYDEALELYPHYTVAREERIYEDVYIEEMIADYEYLLKDNEFSIQGNQMAAAIAFYSGDYKKMCEYENKVISLTPFYVTEYDSYADKLKEVIESMRSEDGGLSSEADYYVEEIKALPVRMQDVKDGMSELGRSIVSQPTGLHLSEEMLEYIKSLD